MIECNIELGEDGIESGANEIEIEIRAPQNSQFERNNMRVLKQPVVVSSSSSTLERRPLPRNLLPWPTKMHKFVKYANPTDEATQTAKMSTWSPESVALGNDRLFESSETETTHETEIENEVSSGGFYEVRAQECRIYMKRDYFQEEQIQMAYGFDSSITRVGNQYKPQPIAFKKPSETEIDTKILINKLRKQKIKPKHKNDLQAKKGEIIRKFPRTLEATTVIRDDLVVNTKEINKDESESTEMENNELCEKLSQMLDKLKEHIDEVHLNVQSANNKLETIITFLRKSNSEPAAGDKSETEANSDPFISEILNSFEEVFKALQYSTGNENKKIREQRTNLLKSMKSIVKDLRDIKRLRSEVLGQELLNAGTLHFQSTETNSADTNNEAQQIQVHEKVNGNALIDLTESTSTFASFSTVESKCNRKKESKKSGTLAVAGTLQKVPSQKSFFVDLDERKSSSSSCLDEMHAKELSNQNISKETTCKPKLEKPPMTVTNGSLEQITRLAIKLVREYLYFLKDSNSSEKQSDSQTTRDKSSVAQVVLFPDDKKLTIPTGSKGKIKNSKKLIGVETCDIACKELPTRLKHNASPNDSVSELITDKCTSASELMEMFLKSSIEESFSDNCNEAKVNKEERPHCSNDRQVTYKYMSSDVPKTCECCSRCYDPVFDKDIIEVILFYIKDYDHSDIVIQLSDAVNDVIYVEIMLMNTAEQIKCFYATTAAIEKAEVDGIYQFFNVNFV